MIGCVFPNISKIRIVLASMDMRSKKNELIAIKIYTWINFDGYFNKEN